MKRDLMAQLRTWQKSKNRKPLILKGVRQTGKSYLLNQFGAENFSRCHVINFEKQETAKRLFDSDLNPQNIIQRLEFLLQTSIDIHSDLLVFDEIQACERALTSLKYFCEDMPELALCSAGSLLGLHLSSGSFPVGKVDMLHLFPLTFGEFLRGIEDLQLADYLDELKTNDIVVETAHVRLWERLKQYFVVGGLPEAVVTFATRKDSLFGAMQAVRQKHEELINAYYADMAKHSGKVNAMHIDRIFRSVPAQLARESEDINRFKFKGVVPGVNRYQHLASAIDWLEAAELVYKVPIVEHVEQPLLAYVKENVFKLFIFDVGILGAMSGLEPETILNYSFGTYKGYFAENFVLQQIVTHNAQKPICWQEDRSEVEFLIQHKGHIVPIEVKAGSVTRAKSLQKYIRKYSPQHAVIFSAKATYVEEGVTVRHLPLYLADRDFLN